MTDAEFVAAAEQNSFWRNSHRVWREYVNRIEAEATTLEGQAKLEYEAVQKIALCLGVDLRILPKHVSPRTPTQILANAAGIPVSPSVEDIL